MIKAIIFDCFGVLADDGWLPLKRKYIGDNKKLAEEIADLGKQNEYGFIDNETHLRRMAQLMDIDREVLRAALRTRVPNEELFAYIKMELKPHYKIGLLTNANYDVLHDLFTPEQAALFDGYVMSRDIRLIKPDKRMFEAIALRLDVHMDECLFVDDVERYVEAAKEYGMQAIWWRDGEQGMADLRAYAQG